ncbi:MAG: domain S-box, partial [Chloroflexi bacterium]|nr:domain S-box [Chloroflexota bacterium]
NGISFPIELTFVRVPGSEPGTLLAGARDITKRQRAEQALQESEERYRNLVETTQDGILQIDSMGYITHVNEQMAGLLGYSVEEMLGTSVFAYIWHTGRATMQANLEQRVDTGHLGENIVNRFELELLHKNGAHLWVLVSMTSIFDRSRRYAGSLAMVTDITDRKRTEAALQTSEERLRTVVANVPLILWAVDADGIFTVYEGTGLRHFNLEPGMHVGDSIWHVLRDFPEIAADVRRAFAGEDMVAVREVGGRVIETRHTLLRGKDGAVSGLIGVATDFTEQKRAGEERARLAAIVDSSEDAITTASLDGILQSWNAGAERLFGYTAAEAIGRPAAILEPPDRPREIADILMRLKEGERISNFETVRVAKTGSTIDISLAVSPVIDDTGRIIGASSIDRDITERKQAQREAEHARRVAEELAQLREERAREAQAMADVGASISSVLEPSELYHRVLEQVARIVPCDYADIRGYEDGWVTSIASWGEPCYAPGTRLFPLVDDQGRWLPSAHDKVVYVSDTNEEANWIAVPPRNEEAHVRSMITVPLIVDDEPIGSFTVSSRTPNFYSDHHIQLVTALAGRAMQALRNARLFAAEQERARAAEELAQVQNDFVAAASHELRTPLTAILGFTELLQKRWTRLDDGKRLEAVGRIAHAANRQLRLVEDLLLLNRLDNESLIAQSQPIEIASLVQQAADEVMASYREQQIDLDGPPGITVQADPSRFLQIVANLLDNAAKYSPEGSAVRASWGVEGKSAVLRVQDHGSGIPEQDHECLFRRFGRVPGSRMREGHVGTGLGLYLGRQLARAMGGDLDLETTSSEGSIFRLKLAYVPV